MTIGDKVSKIAQEFIFPIVNIFDQTDEKSGKKIYHGPNGVKCLYNNKSLDKLVIWEQWVFKEYNEEFLPENSCILEIGSHIGTSTIHFANKYPKGKVFGVEALPEHFNLLNRNIEINNLKNVWIENYAVVGNPEIEQVDFSINPYNSAGHSIYGDTMTDKEVIKVNAITIERLIDKLHLKKINALHIDVEGAEYEILLNMKKSILRSIDYISLEYHDILQTKYNHEVLINLLRSLGFKTSIKRTLLSRLLRLETGIISAVK